MTVATLYARDVPDDLYEALRRRAAERGSSIAAESVRLLRRALVLERAGQAELIDAIRAEREPLRPGAPTAAELIRKDRQGR